MSSLDEAQQGDGAAAAAASSDGAGSALGAAAAALVAEEKLENGEEDLEDMEDAEGDSDDDEHADLSAQDLLAKIKDLKTQGNAKIKAKDYDGARSLYGEGLMLESKLALRDGGSDEREARAAGADLRISLQSNMSLACVNLKDWDGAVVGLSNWGVRASVWFWFCRSSDTSSSLLLSSPLLSSPLLSSPLLSSPHLCLFPPLPSTPASSHTPRRPRRQPPSTPTRRTSRRCTAAASRGLGSRTRGATAVAPRGSSVWPATTLRPRSSSSRRTTRRGASTSLWMLG